MRGSRYEMADAEICSLLAVRSWQVAVAVTYTRRWLTGYVHAQQDADADAFDGDGDGDGDGKAQLPRLASSLVGTGRCAPVPQDDPRPRGQNVPNSQI